LRRLIVLSAAVFAALMMWTGFRAGEASLAVENSPSGTGGEAEILAGDERAFTGLPEPESGGGAPQREAGDEELYTVSESGGDYSFDAAKLYSCRGTFSISYREYRSIMLVNNERASRGLSKLCVQRKLTATARYWSNYLLKNYAWGHGCFECRLSYFGYDYSRGAGNNLARGQFWSPQEAHNAWMRSSSHRANMLDPKWRQIGAGVKFGKYGPYNNFRIYDHTFGVCDGC